MADKFDFIIVGGGTAGCLLANRLSNSTKQPSVLLIEIGGEGLPTERRQCYQRYANAFELTDLEHGYKTVPQSGLNGQELAYQRGKGLGGSSMLNFMVYTRGPAADYDHWADLVGDKEWGWEKAVERFKEIETFHDNIDSKLRKYVNPAKENHGYEGGLHVTVPEKEIESEIAITMDAAEELGWRINPDVNSGDVTGISVVPVSSGHGQRYSGEKAFLQTQPDNLTVWTYTQVSRVLFEGKKAIGIETLDGKKALASKEIILSSGSIDTPKLLLLSGIGPAAELTPHGIPSVHDLPAVGKNAVDHVAIFVTSLMDRSFSSKFEFALDTKQQEAALEQWTKDHTGRLSHHGSSNAIVFKKDEKVYETEAFKSLPEEEQAFLRRPEIPTFEIITSGPVLPATWPMSASESCHSRVLIVLNCQSRGSVTLRSADPRDQALIDPAYFTHPYDMQAMMAAVRADRELTGSRIMRGHYRGKEMFAPRGGSEEEVEAFVKEYASPIWHFSTTAKMGKKGDETAVVDSDMKVFGVQGLRVADLSVIPFNPNAHTQAAAYLIGQTAADKIIAEYELN